MLGSRKLVHIAADFGDHAARRDSIDTRNDHQQVDLVLKRMTGCSIFCANSAIVASRNLQLVKEFLQLETVPFLKATFEC